MDASLTPDQVDELRRIHTTLGHSFPLPEDASESVVERVTVAVVEAAKDPENPLHSLFEWDVEEAARKHRLHVSEQMADDLLIHGVPASKLYNPDRN